MQNKMWIYRGNHAYVLKIEKHRKEFVNPAKNGFAVRMERVKMKRLYLPQPKKEDEINLLLGQAYQINKSNQIKIALQKIKLNYKNVVLTLH